jgi:tRNA A37 threonylcarbamoyladenosine synthetase subunit TsaC/SUA5/YrdC
LCKDGAGKARQNDRVDYGIVVSVTPSKIPDFRTPGFNSMISKDGEETRLRAAKVIVRGGIVAFRTDTFYGLGVNPFDERALRSLNDLKGRDAKPILVIISDRAQAELHRRYHNGRELHVDGD